MYNSKRFVANVNNFILFFRGGSVLERSPCMRGSIPSRYRPTSFKQVVTAPMAIARQKVRVSWVLGDDHQKRMTRVSVGVAR